MGLWSLGIPGTNHKGTGVDHASCTPYRSPYLPAPVVPPVRWEESNDGDWWIVYSLPLIEISTDGARGLSIPRLLLGMSCA